LKAGGQYKCTTDSIDKKIVCITENQAVQLIVIEVKHPVFDFQPGFRFFLID
jgi:hypothetical protein